MTHWSLYFNLASPWESACRNLLLLLGFTGLTLRADTLLKLLSHTRCHSLEMHLIRTTLQFLTWAFWWLSIPALGIKDIHTYSAPCRGKTSSLRRLEPRVKLTYFPIPCFMAHLPTPTWFQENNLLMECECALWVWSGQSTSRSFPCSPPSPSQPQSSFLRHIQTLAAAPWWPGMGWNGWVPRVWAESISAGKWANYTVVPREGSHPRREGWARAGRGWSQGGTALCRVTSSPL